jgi:hypothetical protein
VATPRRQIPHFAGVTLRLLDRRLEQVAARMGLDLGELATLKLVVLLELYGPQPAAPPTAAEPGTHAKIRVMAERYRGGAALFQPGDPTLTNPSDGRRRAEPEYLGVIRLRGAADEWEALDMLCDLVHVPKKSRGLAPGTSHRPAYAPLDPIFMVSVSRNAS